MSNTTHKLTAQMVSAYPNAMVIETETGDMYDVLCVHGKFNSINVQLSNSEGISDVFSFVQTSHFQLVLTSPDKITDAQALEISKWNLNGSESEPTPTAEHGRWSIEAILKGRYSLGLIQSFTDVCRRNNIDVGYCEGYCNIPSLIAAGLAVENNIINE